MKLHISVPNIKKLAPAATPYEAVDDDIKGFLARVQPTGVITYYFTYRTADGTRQRHRIGRHPGITAPAARKAAEQLAATVSQGSDPHAERKASRAKKARAKHETLGGFIELKYSEWALSHQRRGAETLQLLKSNFESVLYKRKLAAITAWDIQKWRSDKDKEGLKPTTVNRRVTTLKAVLNKAVEWDVIASNPLQKIKPLKVDSKTRVRYLSRREEQLLRGALDEREQELRDGRLSGNEWRETRGRELLAPIDAYFADYLKPIVVLALNTGLRRGELFNLSWSDVDLTKRMLTVEGSTAKSGQTRYVQLNTEAVKLLRHWQAQSSSPLVFPSPITGKRLNNIKRSWGMLKERAGVTGFRFHDLRHTFASKMVMAGVDLYTVKELMGHSTIQMTERYAHLAPEHKASAVERLVDFAANPL
jgi:integrase